LLGPRHTQLKSNKPVISVTAVRTGSGKSPISQKITGHLTARGTTIGVLRHPMPYGDLKRQEVQCFRTVEDLATHECTVEEREEYEPYLERGLPIYAGVDYAKVLAQAEQENQLILWDGGNNDLPFIASDLRVVIADALRPGHEIGFYPGESNFRSADVLVINKVAEARKEDVEQIRERAAALCPNAKVIEGDLALRVADPDALKGRRVLVVEDGPTLTHGGMSFGAGFLAAKRFGAAEIIDPRPHAVGTIKAAFEAYPHIEHILPALGYSDAQRDDLRGTIEAARPDAVVDASPAKLGRVLGLSLPVVSVGYEFEQRTGPDLVGIIDAFVADRVRG
jgi:predicted GTPase